MTEHQARTYYTAARLAYITGRLCHNDLEGVKQYLLQELGKPEGQLSGNTAPKLRR